MRMAWVGVRTATQVLMWQTAGVPGGPEVTNGAGTRSGRRVVPRGAPTGLGFGAVLSDEYGPGNLSSRRIAKALRTVEIHRASARAWVSSRTRG
jgi:hypothetical protein